MTKISLTNKPIAELSEKYCRIVLTEDKPNWHRLVETTNGHLEYRMGVGKRENMTVRSYRILVRSIVQAAKSHQLENIALYLKVTDYPKLKDKEGEWFCRTLAENLQLAQYQFKKYKTKKKDAKELREILVYGIETPAEKRGFSAGLIIGKSINTTRDIANTTGEHMTPSKMVTATKAAMKDTGASVKVLDYKAIKIQKMGLLEAVGKGASDKPKLILIEYWGAGKPTIADKKTGKKNPIALIGKGITYDSGGLNVKPAGGMHDMHMDMTGGATVIGTIQALAKLKIRRNVVGIIPVAENSISADSMRSGDIVTSMSGKNVEILHTDAEGRLVLADAMTYTEKHYKPSVILDIATLTGASLVALGQHTSAVLTKDENLSKTIIELGEDTGDLMWPLPLWDEYKSMLKSNRADYTNIANNFSRFAGCIEGGIFLSFFAPKNIPWAHIDIAPRMDSVPSDKLAKGATGEPVRLLVKFVENHK